MQTMPNYSDRSNFVAKRRGNNESILKYFRWFKTNYKLTTAQTLLQNYYSFSNSQVNALTSTIMTLFLE